MVLTARTASDSARIEASATDSALASANAAFNGSAVKRFISSIGETLSLFEYSAMLALGNVSIIEIISLSVMGSPGCTSIGYSIIRRESADCFRVPAIAGVLRYFRILFGIPVAFPGERRIVSVWQVSHTKPKPETTMSVLNLKRSYQLVCRKNECELIDIARNGLVVYRGTYAECVAEAKSRKLWYS